jgi:hypothetical protein
MATSGIGKAILGGWQLNGLWTWESGLPLLFDGAPTASLNAPGNKQWPQQVAPVQILGNAAPGYWFTTASFAPAPTGAIGNVGRNILNGPRLFAINGSVFRRFSLTERFKLEFRAESFNLTNTKQLDPPGTTLGDPTFGLVTTAQGTQAVKINPNRLYQGSLRITF